MKFLLFIFVIISFSPKFAVACDKKKLAEDCDFTIYAPVVGKDKQCYLNKCWAEKKGVKVAKVGYKKKIYKKVNVYTWPIEDVCIPVAKEQPVIRDLEDGTLLYTYTDREFRGTPNRCRCLPGSTQILTSVGNVPIDQLKENDKVLSINSKGEKVEMRIKMVNKVEIVGAHSMVLIELKDGRKLQVSPGHPSSIANKNLGEFIVGEKLEGVSIVKITDISYAEPFTFDILPEGDTGFYWANGILIGSTLKVFDTVISKK